MLTRYFERRQHIRVPAAGLARWRSGAHSGYCETIDISPVGVGVRVRARSASRFGEAVTIVVSLPDGATWPLVEDARVARVSPDLDGQCIVGLIDEGGRVGGERDSNAAILKQRPDRLCVAGRAAD